MLTFKNAGFLNKLGRLTAWLLFSLLILGISMLTSFQPLWANIPMNIVIPIIVLIFLKTVFFEKLKLSTLIIMRALIVLAVLGVIKGDFYVKLVLIFLVINILEATLTDFKKKKYFNVATGLILAISVVTLQGVWMETYYVANTATILATIAWIIAYTLWNWIFVTNEFTPAIAFLHVGILLAPIVGSLIMWNPGFWLIFRGNSLTVGGVFQIASKDYLEHKLEDKKFTKFVRATQTNRVQLVLMVVNIILLLVPIIYYFVG